MGENIGPLGTSADKGLYRLEVAILTFYGCLMLVTPAFSGLMWGRLPTEISTRGTKFADEADQSAALNEAAIMQLERNIDRLTEDLARVIVEIDELKKGGDST